MRSRLRVALETHFININDSKVKMSVESELVNINEIRLRRRFDPDGGNLVEKVSQSLLKQAARESCPRESV